MEVRLASYKEKRPVILEKYMELISKQLLLAVSIVVAQIAVAPLHAQSPQTEEKEQLGNSPSPDVLPDSSQQGPSQSIQQQERDQIDNSAAPDVDPGASKGPDQPITKQEQNQLR